MAVVGRIETGSYTNKDGAKVYTTSVIVEEQEFAESKNASKPDGTGSSQAPATSTTTTSADDFLEATATEDLPWV